MGATYLVLPVMDEEGDLAVREAARLVQSGFSDRAGWREAPPLVHRPGARDEPPDGTDLDGLAGLEVIEAVHRPATDGCDVPTRGIQELLAR